MDIYSFINSKDIAAHCREINHQFTPHEMAYIVYQSTRTIREKHAAWNEIINTVPDVEVPERRDDFHTISSYYESLHEFLRSYMDMENRMLKDFKADADDAVFQFGVYYEGRSRNVCKGNAVFSTLSAVFAAIKEDYMDKDEKILRLQITKRQIDHDECGIIITTPEEEPIRIWSYYGDYWCEKDRDLFHHFEAMWVEIPTPFKRGDLLVCSDLMNTTNLDSKLVGAFVLERICYWNADEKCLEARRKIGNYTDMTAQVYWLDKGGRVSKAFMHAYQDMEYYRGELKGTDRTLKALSKYMKGEIDVIDLMNAYHIILNGKSNTNDDRLLRLTGLLPKQNKEGTE